MSEQYPGGFITKVPPTPAGPYDTSSATGMWNLSQQAAYKQQGLWPTAGNVPPDAFVEGVFSTYIWSGTGNQLSINNGLNLLGNGGMVWIKNRTNAYSNQVFDTVRGFTYSGSQPMGNNLQTNTTDAQAYLGYGFSAFNSNGFRVGYDNGAGTNVADTNVNGSGNNYVAWAFQEKAKFFDIVTVNSSTTTYNHNLGSTPGCIIVKCTDATGANWVVWHRSFSDTTNNYLSLNTSDAVANSTGAWPSAPTSTQFSVKPSLWANGTTGIAYLFAHDAGGFGLSGTENIISCGSYSGNGSATGPVVPLGYEPQLVMIKKLSGGSISDGSSSWMMIDTMRDFSDSDRNDNYLNPNLNVSESDLGASNFCAPLATGFQLTSTANLTNQTGSTYIYIAIRRGPMAVPTDATTVFNPTLFSGNGSSGSYSNTFPTDMIWHSTRNTAGNDHFDYDRLRSIKIRLNLNNNSADNSSSFYTTNISQNLVSYSGNASGFNASGETYVDYSFRRAPGFMDEVCTTLTGASSNERVTHNLGVPPELIIMKTRVLASSWYTYNAPQGRNYWMSISSGASNNAANSWGTSNPTATDFGVASDYFYGSSQSVVFYLFATCPGVSKVGSYTGTGATQTINCGFTAGSRFVMIKRTDSGGDWYFWDSARGIVSGNDPYLLLNNTDAEVTGTDYVDTSATGFEISSTAPAAINANGGSFIFLAIA